MKRLFNIAAPVVAAVVVALILPPDGLVQNAWYFFAIFIAVVLGLIVETLPGSAIGNYGCSDAYATGPAPVNANSGYITSAEYWRLGTVFGIIFFGAFLLLSVPAFSGWNDRLDAF